MTLRVRSLVGVGLVVLLNNVSAQEQYPSTDSPLPVPGAPTSGTVVAPSASMPKLEIAVRMGISPMKAEGGNYTFSVIDDSPTPDTLEKQGTIDPSNFDYGLQIALSAYAGKPVHWELLFDATLGQSKYYGFGFGAGYNIQVKKDHFVIRPAALGSLGSIRMDMGTLEVNDGYAQINATIYDINEDLDVTFRGSVFATTPKVDFVWIINKRVTLGLSGGYRFAWKMGDPYAEFTGLSSGVEASESVNLNDHDLDFNIDGVPAAEQPYAMNGVMALLSVGFAF